MGTVPIVDFLGAIYPWRMANDLARAALEFAAKAHGDQRYGAFPYTRHLNDALRILAGLSEDAELHAAALLHDTLEDTAATEDELRRRFGDRVTSIVRAVTRGQEGDAREPLERYYARIKATPDATLIKLCDRIANVEACSSATAPQKLAKYRDRYPKFRAALRVPGQHDALWARLETAIAREP